jgi:hypothetical protein
MSYASTVGSAAAGTISTVATGIGSVATGVGSLVGGYLGWKKTPEKDHGMMGYMESGSSGYGGGYGGSYYNPPTSGGGLASQDSYNVSTFNRPA